MGRPMVASEKLPTRLGIEPLIEALWELRFKPRHDAAAAVLIGRLLSAFGSSESVPQRLPAADLPLQMRDMSPDLRYAVTLRFWNGRFFISVGERSVVLSCPRPYVGWKAFKAQIEALAVEVRRSDVVENCERMSLKYIDIVELGDKPALEWLDADIRLGEHRVQGQATALRTELVSEDCIHLVQVGLPTEAKAVSGEMAKGVMVDVDSVVTNNHESAKFWDSLPTALESVHGSNKKLFFSLLTKETLKALKPEYE